MLINNSKDLLPFKDKLYIYLGKTKGWRPQISVLNCNKARIWDMLVEEKSSTFHYLERTHLKQKLIYNYSIQDFEVFDEEKHTPKWKV